MSWFSWYINYIYLTPCQGWILSICISLLQSHLCGVLLHGTMRKNVEELYPSFLEAPYISVPIKTRYIYDTMPFPQRVYPDIQVCGSHVHSFTNIRISDVLYEVHAWIFNIWHIYISKPMKSLQCMRSQYCNYGNYDTTDGKHCGVHKNHVPCSSGVDVTKF